MSSISMSAGLRHLRGLMAAQCRSTESDEQLLNAFTTHSDEDAFAVLVRRHGPMVLHVCRRVLVHEQDAEDAFQATFLLLAKSAAGLRNKSALAAFLHGAAYRIAQSAKRSAARRRKHEGAASGGAQQRRVKPPDDPADELSWREARALLDEEIARLPEKYRVVFVLFYLEDLSREETARRLGLKDATVAKRLAEARKRLAQRLARRGVVLTAVLAATGLVTPMASALPAGLMATTIQAAIATAAGEGLAGVVSVSVAELVKSAAAAMMASKAKNATAVLLALSLLTVATSGSLVNWYGRTSGPLAVAPELPVAKADDKPKPASPQREAARGMEIQGRVLDPEGKPVSGAKLFVTRPTKDEPSHNLAVAGTTDAQGRFRFSFRRLDGDSPNYLLAHAAGFGVDWVEVSEGERPAEVTLRLAKDVPITGRVVNTEGQPVAGVSLSIAEIYIPDNEKLDDYLAGWLSNWHDNLFSPRKRLAVPFDGATGTATTDNEGRFNLRGAGAERIVYVKLSGGGMARETLHIITRPGFDAAPYNAVLRKEEIKRQLALNPFRGLDPPSLTFVAQPGKTIEGAIKDADSGKPIRGGVSVYIGWSEHITALSDDNGKYRLEGVPKNPRGYDVTAGRPDYLFRRQHAADTAGFEKVKLDLAIARGAVVTGRVVDKRTGKGVPCGVRFAPLADNKFFGSKPGFDSYRHNRAWMPTDKDGRFRQVTIPGKALILAEVFGGEKFNGEHLCVYRQAVPDPDHPDVFKPNEDGWVVATANGVESSPLLGNAVKVIDVKENGETRVELFLDRGATAGIAVQDADGKPLAGAWVAGLTEHSPITYKLPEATATVYALNPDKPRTMAFYHAEKKLGGIATVRGDEKTPVVVKLAPLGKVSGRLLDGDGNTLEGIEVSINPPGVIGSELYRFAAPSGKPVRTDKDGRFHIEGVVPDLKFELILRGERAFFVGEPRIGARQVKPGEALDLGAIRVKPAQ